VEYVHVQMPIANLPETLVGKRLVQLTDLHIGPRVDDEFLIETFAAVQRLAPEFVVYTGDFTSYERKLLARAKRIFPQLARGTRGTFGVLGNHDYGLSWKQPEVAQELADIARDAGVQILRNSVAEVDGLQVVGLDDLWSGRFNPRRAFGAVHMKAAKIALTHNPDTVDLPGWEDYRGWILAGHTHGGQCKPPFLPPPLLPVKNRTYTAGTFELSGGRTMYINRGLGHLLQVRFNVRPEVTVFTLQRAGSPA
jgi:predicted MPP superfamily phosphohydrolase